MERPNIYLAQESATYGLPSKINQHAACLQIVAFLTQMKLVEQQHKSEMKLNCLIF